MRAIQIENISLIWMSGSKCLFYREIGMLSRCRQCASLYGWECVVSGMWSMFGALFRFKTILTKLLISYGHLRVCIVAHIHEHQHADTRLFSMTLSTYYAQQYPLGSETLELNSNYHINLRYLNAMWYRSIFYLFLLSQKCTG